MQTKLLLDSGAYSAYTRKAEVSLDSYIEYLKKTLLVYPDLLYINLDVIGEGSADTGEQSYENWRKMREAGLNPLPVYHVNSNTKWLKKYLKRTDYIGLGAIADMITRRRVWALDRIWEDFLIDENRAPKVRVHALGVTAYTLIKRYPWFSVDSTSWLQAAMFGKVFIPHTLNGAWDYSRDPLSIIVSLKSPRIKDEGTHIHTLTENRQAVFLRYFKECGFPLGKSRFEGEEEIVEEKGLCNDYYARCYLNCLFFARFTSLLAWPRPFEAQKPKGLFS